MRFERVAPKFFFFFFFFFFFLFFFCFFCFVFFFLFCFVRIFGALFQPRAKFVRLLPPSSHAAQEAAMDGSKRARPGEKPASSFADELAADASAAGAAGAADTASWARPPLPDLSPATDSVCFQWMEMDMHEGEPLAANPRAGASLDSIGRRRGGQRKKKKCAVPNGRPFSVLSPFAPLQACPCRARARAWCPYSPSTA